MATRIRGTTRLLLACWLMATACLLCGCGRTQGKLSVKTYPVKGRVALDGKPAAGASIMLLPAELKDQEPSSPPEHLVGAIANERGEFELVTNGLKKGAPAGKYLVAVTWHDPSVEVNAEDEVRGKDLMPPNYRDPRKSGLEYEVVAAASQRAPLELDLKQPGR